MFTNPFRINLDTLNKARGEGWTDDTIRRLITSQWSQLNYRLDTNSNQVAHAADLSTPWDEVLANWEPEFSVPAPIEVEDMIDLYERLIPLFDKIQDGSLYLDTSLLTIHSAVLPIYRS